MLFNYRYYHIYNFCVIKLGKKITILKRKVIKFKKKINFKILYAMIYIPEIIKKFILLYTSIYILVEQFIKIFILRIY